MDSCGSGKPKVCLVGTAEESSAAASETSATVRGLANVHPSASCPWLASAPYMRASARAVKKPLELGRHCRFHVVVLPIHVKSRDSTTAPTLVTHRLIHPFAVLPYVSEWYRLGHSSRATRFSSDTGSFPRCRSPARAPQDGSVPDMAEVASVPGRGSRGVEGEETFAAEARSHPLAHHLPDRHPAHLVAA
eukprot:132758-Rhodomonas_salina.3